MSTPPLITDADLAAMQGQIERATHYLDLLATRSRVLPRPAQRVAQIEEVMVSLQLSQAVLNAATVPDVTEEQVRRLMALMSDAGQRLGHLRLAINQIEREQGMPAPGAPEDAATIAHQVARYAEALTYQDSATVEAVLQQAHLSPALDAAIFTWHGEEAARMQRRDDEISAHIGDAADAQDYADTEALDSDN